MIRTGKRGRPISYPFKLLDEFIIPWDEGDPKKQIQRLRSAASWFFRTHRRRFHLTITPTGIRLRRQK